MGNLFKSTWWIFLLVLSGGVIFFLSVHANKPQGDQGVVLNDIFHQQVSSVKPSSVPLELPKKADTVPSMAMVTSPSPVNAEESGLTIQVYSFQDKNRALSALQTLRTSGYQTSLILSDLGEKGVWYRVRVGGIKDEMAARKMLEEIRKNYNSGFILKPLKGN